MKTKTLVLTIAAVFFAASYAAADDPPETLTLTQALDIAAKNNPSLIESRNRWEEKKRGIAITNGWPNPEIGFMKDDIPSSTLNPFDGMMSEYSLSQEIMNPLKLTAMRSMAKSGAGMAGADFEDKRMRVYAAVKQAYYELLYAEKALEIMKENQELMGQLLRISAANYSTGVSPLQDNLRAQTEYSKMAAGILNMAAMTEAARNRLNYFLGREANTPLAIKEEFSVPASDFDFDALRQEAHNSPAVQSMVWGVEMAKNNVTMAERELLPDFKIGLGWVKTKSMNETPDPMNMGPPAMSSSYAWTWKAELMVMLPLWFGQYQAKKDSASAALEATQASLIDMRNMAGMELSMAVNEAGSARRLIGLYQNTVIPQAGQTFEAERVGYTNGKSELMTVLDSLVTLRNARLDYYKARVDYEKALAEIERIIGRPLNNERNGRREK